MKTRISIERYNQIVWAVIGSGALIFAAIGIVTFVVSLWPRGQTGVPVEVVKDPVRQQATLNLRGDPCLPITIPGTRTQIIGVAMDRIVIGGKSLATRAEKGFGSSDHYEPGPAGCGYASAGQMSVAGGVLIRDTRTGALRTLLPQSALIQQMEYPVPRRSAGTADEQIDRFPPEGVLYWEIAMADSNSDGLLNNEDDIGAYLSDVDGANLVRISPPRSRVMEKSYDAERKVLTMRISALADRNDSKHNPQISIVEANIPQRRIIGTVMESENWQRLLERAKPLNSMP